MGFIEKAIKQYKEYCLIGLNKFNIEIGKILVSEGHKVTVLDIDQKKIDLLGDTFEFAIVCDATNIKELSNIGVQFFDYVILGITDMKTSVIIASNLKELNVTKVLCKAKDEAHKKILKMLGVPISYIPEEEISTKVAYKIMYDLSVELLDFDNSIKDILVIKLPVLNRFLWGKKVSEINFLKTSAVTIISIAKENGKVIVPVSGTNLIEKGDAICLICRKEQAKKLQVYFDMGKH